MAHTGAAAVHFLKPRQKTQAAFERENAKSALNSPGTLGYDDLAPWDISYAAEKQRSALYDFDEEELRPDYFELDNVITGMFEIFSRLLGIRVVERPGIPGWDSAVKHYRLEDGETGELLGGFYTDWFPRENKRGGAWVVL